MPKCPYCHIEYNSNESFNAHIANCGVKNNPVEETIEPPAPDPEATSTSQTMDDASTLDTQTIDKTKHLNSLKVEDLKKLAAEKNIDVEGLKKAEMIEKLTAYKDNETGD